jgi:fermentation-respiration switch protein FrsA (DUF1100 family)
MLSTRSCRLRWATLIALTLGAGGCSSLGPVSPLLPVERKIVFHPAKYPAGNWKPEDLGAEDAWFEAEGGPKLHGWFVEHPRPRAVALFCHGNAGNITVLADSLRILNVRHRLSVLTFDYRGYGRSGGKPSEAGILADARAARRWLAERTHTPEKDIILMGQSLGGAVAVDLAAADGARALVLASTFTSLPDVAASTMPWLLPHWNMTLRFDSAAKITKYSGPVLISHGEADEIIPFAQGKKLYEAAPGTKRFYPEPGAKHNDRRSEGYREVFEEFLTMVDTLPLPSTAAPQSETETLTAVSDPEDRLTP